MSKSWGFPIRNVVLCFAGAVAVFAAYRLADAQENLDAYQFSRQAQQGMQITPVKVNLMGKDANLVYIGSYLVNGPGGCNGCHTCPSFSGTNPFTVGAAGLPSGPPPNGNGNNGNGNGGVGNGNGNGNAKHTPVNFNSFLAGGTPFPNGGKPFQGSVLTSANLTPDSSGLPGGLTYDDFKSAMVNGAVSTKPGHILLVMPWPTLHNLYENDLVAIYQYLSAIPPAQPGTCTGAGQTGP